MNFPLNDKEGWIIPANTEIPANTIIPAFSTLGGYCKLGEDSRWLGIIAKQWLTLANVDGSGRQIKIVSDGKQVKIEAGCFNGTGQEFLAKAESEGKMIYVAVIGAICAAMVPA